MTPREALRARCEQIYDEQLVNGGRMACVTALARFLAAERAAEAEACLAQYKTYPQRECRFMDWCEARAAEWREKG